MPGLAVQRTGVWLSFGRYQGAPSAETASSDSRAILWSGNNNNSLLQRWVWLTLQQKELCMPNLKTPKGFLCPVRVVLAFWMFAYCLPSQLKKVTSTKPCKQPANSCGRSQTLSDSSLEDSSLTWEWLGGSVVI